MKEYNKNLLSMSNKTSPHYTKKNSSSIPNTSNKSKTSDSKTFNNEEPHKKTDLSTPKSNIHMNNKYFSTTINNNERISHPNSLTKLSKKRRNLTCISCRNISPGLMNLTTKNSRSKSKIKQTIDYSKYDTKKYEYLVQHDLSKPNNNIEQPFLTRMQNDVMKRQTKDLKRNKIIENHKPKKSEEIRNKCFNRLIHDSDKRIKIQEKKKNLQNFLEDGFVPKKISKRKWNKIYEERFLTFEKKKSENLLQKIIEKKKVMNQNEEKIIEEINKKTKKVTKKELDVIVNRLALNPNKNKKKETKKKNDSFEGGGGNNKGEENMNERNRNKIGYSIDSLGGDNNLNLSTGRRLKTKLKFPGAQNNLSIQNGSKNIDNNKKNKKSSPKKNKKYKEKYLNVLNKYGNRKNRNLFTYKRSNFFKRMENCINYGFNFFNSNEDNKSKKKDLYKIKNKKIKSATDSKDVNKNHFNKKSQIKKSISTKKLLFDEKDFLVIKEKPQTDFFKSLENYQNTKSPNFSNNFYNFNNENIINNISIIKEDNNNLNDNDNENLYNNIIGSESKENSEKKIEGPVHDFENLINNRTFKRRYYSYGYVPTMSNNFGISSDNEEENKIMGETQNNNFINKLKRNKKNFYTDILALKIVDNLFKKKN